MVNKLSFNAPILFHSQQSFRDDDISIRAKGLGKLTDGYFSFWGPKAVLLKNDGSHTYVQLINSPESACKKFFKAVTWITVIIPILMLIGKIVFRALNSFRIEQGSITQEEVIEGIKGCISDMPEQSIKDYKEKFSKPNVTFVWGHFRDQYLRSWEFIVGTHAKGVVPTYYAVLENSFNQEQIIFNSQSKDQLTIHNYISEKLNITK